MNRSTMIRLAVAAIAAAAVAGLAWWIGMQQGMAMMASPQAVAAAPADPSMWTIPQGESATRRHIRDGLKAGDVDPVTGLRILNYHDPMVPGRNFDAPAKSPFMDMMLVPRYAGSGAAAGAGSEEAGVTVSPRVRQNLGLRTAVVERGTLDRAVDVVGNVAWNERDQVVLAARAMGFVEKLHVRATLDRVAAGAPLLDLYVPEWVAAQEEFLAVARMQGEGIDALRDAARARMRQAGMDEALVERVAREGRALPRVTLRAPIAGVLTELMVREGATVMPGMPLLRVQGSASVWADAEVPEGQAAALRVGARATATSPSGEVFEGRVQALLPQVDPATRTLKARLELANRGARLVPGLFLRMRIEGLSRRDVLLLPTDAVIRTGRRSVVMLAESEGRYRPVAVRTGVEADDRIEITEGLEAGQEVVLSGQFLIDSEASLRGFEARLNVPAAASAAASGAAPSTTATHRTDARITAVSGDTVTLDHPPIASLKWPQMVMDFRLPPPARRPAGLAPGQSVRVEFQMQDGDVPRITAITPLPAGGRP